jgi:hypothetical protein
MGMSTDQHIYEVRSNTGTTLTGSLTLTEAREYADWFGANGVHGQIFTEEGSGARGSTARDLIPGDVIAWRGTTRTIADVIDEGQRSIVGNRILLVVKYREGGWEYVPADRRVERAQVLWTVTMRHDGGTVDITMSAPSADEAVRRVCTAENAPLRSAVAVRPA